MVANHTIPPYDPSEVEARWRNFWADRGFFRTDAEKPTRGGRALW